jgi:hypothetical protein
VRKLLILFMLAVALPAAEPGTSAYLLEACRQAVKLDAGDKRVDALDVGYCFGYVQGVLDSLGTRDRLEDVLKWPRTICPPYPVPTDQFVKAIVKFLEDNPDSLRASQWSNALLAMQRAFPCR